MGISTGGDSHGPKSDINVTPLVDVVLVMLIIFLVAMPIQIRKIAIEVPRELNQDEVQVLSNSLSMTIIGQADGSLVLNSGDGDVSITRVELAKTLNQIFAKAEGKEKVVFVDFEDPVKYTDVISIMDTIRGAAPKTTIQDPEGKSMQVPDVKIALTIRDADRQKK